MVRGPRKRDSCGTDPRVRRRDRRRRTGRPLRWHVRRARNAEDRDPRARRPRRRTAEYRIDRGLPGVREHPRLRAGAEVRRPRDQVRSRTEHGRGRRVGQEARRRAVRHHHRGRRRLPLADGDRDRRRYAGEARHSGRTRIRRQGRVVLRGVRRRVLPRPHHRCGRRRRRRGRGGGLPHPVRRSRLPHPPPRGAARLEDPPGARLRQSEDRSSSGTPWSSGPRATPMGCCITSPCATSRPGRCATCR